MTQETIKIAISRADGSVAVMDLIVVGRGSILPDGAVWVSEGWWRRKPTTEVIEKQIERGASYLGTVTGWEIVDTKDIPQDRTFREAWRNRGKRLEVDMPEARKIHLDRVRIARAPLLDQLDRDWMRATGQGKKADADAVEAKRQALRDLTTTIDVESAATPEALKAMWPKELA